MKEIISTIILLVTVYGGTRVLGVIHQGIRNAALEKASKGLPSLVEMNKAIQTRKRSK